MPTASCYKKYLELIQMLGLKILHSCFRVWGNPQSGIHYYTFIAFVSRGLGVWRNSCEMSRQQQSQPLFCFHFLVFENLKLFFESIPFLVGIFVQNGTKADCKARRVNKRNPTEKYSFFKNRICLCGRKFQLPAQCVQSGLTLW